MTVPLFIIGARSISSSIDDRGISTASLAMISGVSPLLIICRICGPVKKGFRSSISSLILDMKSGNDSSGFCDC